MDRSFYRQALEEIPRRLAELMSLPPEKVRLRLGPGSSREAHPDLIARAGDKVFVTGIKADSSAAPVSAAALELRRFAATQKKDAIPLIVTSFMGEVGRRLCAEMGVSWLDLSGNADIASRGLRVHVQGHPNRFKRVGRPASLFAPKSSRIARWLLMHPDRVFTQQELSQKVRLGAGFVSRIVRGLEQEELIEREPNGAVRVRNYDILLDALAEVYDFSRHKIVRGHMAARSSDEVLHRLAEQFENTHLTYAATGLAGAWLLSHHAGFRLVVVYTLENPVESFPQNLGFHLVERGENVWLVLPNDAGVLLGSTRRDGIMCAHPVQVYLDLKTQPERAAEAADHLRKNILMPRRNG